MLKPKCDHANTRLACQDCSGPVCPKCMVQCAVGFRCPVCASKFKSHAVTTTPWILARTALASAVVGYVFAISFPDSYGWIGWLCTYVVGIVVGRGLHWVARYKLGTQICATVAVGIVAGFLLCTAPKFAIYLSNGSDPQVMGFVQQTLAMRLLGGALFVGGCLNPFLRRV